MDRTINITSSTPLFLGEKREIQTSNLRESARTPSRHDVTDKQTDGSTPLSSTMAYTVPPEIVEREKGYHVTS